MLLHEKKKKKELKNKVLSNARDLYKNLYYAYKDKYDKETNSLDTKNREKLHYEKLRLSDYSFEEKQDEPITDMNKFKEWIDNKETDIKIEVFNKYFSTEKPSEIFKYICEEYNIDKKNMTINIVNSELEDLKKKIKKMTKEERETEKIDKIVNIVEEILKFNTQKQEGQGIKILTPSQMLSRLSISLAQLEAGNSSEELKNEIRQLLYSLYRSKNITKQVYNNLMKPI